MSMFNVLANKRVDKKEENYLALEKMARHPGFTLIVSELEAILDALDKSKKPPEQPAEIDVFLPLLVDMITNIWRSQQKMLAPGEGEPAQEFKRAYRPLVSATDRWAQAGFEIRDRTNQPYDVGLLEKVIAYQPAAGIHREIIIETLKPSVYYCGRLLQQGEIIVGVPEA